MRCIGNGRPFVLEVTECGVAVDEKALQVAQDILQREGRGKHDLEVLMLQPVSAVTPPMCLL